MAVILTEQTIDGFAYNSDVGAYLKVLTPSPCTLELEKGYVVSWDGKKCVCTSFIANINGYEMIAIGNGIVAGGENTGEPFAIAYNPSTDYMNFFAVTNEGSHGVAIETTNVVLPGRMLTFSYDSDFGVYANNSGPSLFTPVAGTTYKIVWDGEEFVSIAFTNENFPDQVLIGNTLLIGGEDTKEPYAISSLADGSGMTIFILDQSDTHYVGVHLEEVHGASIVLYNRNGEAETYDGIESLTFDTPDKEKGATFIYGDFVKNAEFEPDFSNGSQNIYLEKGKFLKEFVIVKPENLVPENIKKDENICGIVGTHEGGGGSGTGESSGEDNVRFFDYNGDIVAEYSLSEMATLTELPIPPEHEGLTFQGWNWTLEEIKNEIAITEALLNVGAMYITDDGKTRLYIDINHYSMKSVTMYFCQTVANGVTVDWGDGSTSSTRSGTGAGSLSHTYSELGEYVITLDVVDGCTLTLGYNNSSYGLFGKDDGGIANILKKVEIGKNVTDTGQYTFYFCYCLESISLPNTIKTFGKYTFRHAIELKFVTIPKGVTSIGGDCFYYCYGLKHVSIPIGVSVTGDYVFDYCYTLEEIIFPTASPATGRYIYMQCSGLKLLVNTVTYGSPNYCVKKVVYKANDISVPIKLASYCYGVEKIKLMDHTLSIGSDAFSGCYSLKKIDLPEGIMTIGSSAFNNCQSFREIILPHGVTTIQGSAFNSCKSLRKLVIPSTVTKIASPILNNTYSLREVHFLGATPPVFDGKLLSSGDISKCTFYVPKGSLDAYKSAANFSTYASQIVEE